MKKRGKFIRCKYCKSFFYAHPCDLKRNKQYCSMKCFNKIKKEQPNKCGNYGHKKGRYKKCKICHNKFYVPFCIDKKQYCSLKCRFDAIRKNPKLHPNYKDGRSIIICAICGKENHEQHKKYCSHKCYAIAKSRDRKGSGNTFWKHIHTKKSIKKISKGITKSWKRPYYREERSEYWKQYYIKHPEKHPNHTSKNRKTSIEIKIKSFLDTFLLENKDYYFNKTIWVKDGVLYPDFLLYDKLVIEADGDYFHKDKEKDRIRDKKIKSAEYKIIHLKESDIKNNFKKVENRIEVAIRNVFSIKNR